VNHGFSVVMYLLLSIVCLDVNEITETLFEIFLEW